MLRKNKFNNDKYFPTGWFRAYRVRLKYAFVRAREEGALWTIRELILRGARLAGCLLLSPLTLLLHLAGFRRIPIITNRIGHLAADMDCFLKEKALGRIPHYRWFVLAPTARVANLQLIKYFAQHVTVISNPVACAIIEIMTFWRIMVYDISDYVLALNGSARYYRTNNEWDGRPPVLSLTEEDREAGWKALEQMGVPRGSWFVCFHARESGFSPEDEIVHSYRNSDVMALIPSLREIRRRGGRCIRMGDPSMKPLPKIEGVIDYAHLPLRSDRMDVFLCASCRFFLGNTSGLSMISTVFGVLCGLVNIIPVTSMGWFSGDLCIPKLLRKRNERRYLSFNEILASDVCSYRMSSFYRDAGIEIEDNSPEDIFDLTVEMLDRLDGHQDKFRDYLKLQEAFARLLKPRHYGYGTPARIGGLFLAKHRELL
ncbi:MAG TPA: TIGR04372 family glycosyltransferase [Acidobacteriota bacterium]|nr:TIGR04372 family glycosyltransferase [Burkholderiales bacterium]HYA28638.1 TIGR04372 family glycosyltransferase [Acidobacteriota bacterium]